MDGAIAPPAQPTFSETDPKFPPPQRPLIVKVPLPAALEMRTDTAYRPNLPTLVSTAGTPAKRLLVAPLKALEMSVTCEPSWQPAPTDP
jgi:hypothetical protein